MLWGRGESETPGGCCHTQGLYRSSLSGVHCLFRLLRRLEEGSCPEPVPVNKNYATDLALCVRTPCHVEPWLVCIRWVATALAMTSGWFILGGHWAAHSRRMRDSSFRWSMWSTSLRWTLPTVLSGCIKGLDQVIRDIRVTWVFILLQQDTALGIHTRCVNGPKPSRYCWVSGFHQSPWEASIGLFYCGVEEWDEWDRAFRCLSVVGPVRFPEIPTASLYTSDHRESKTNMDCRWAMLAVGKVLQDCARGRLMMTINHRYPAEIRRVILLPSGGVEGALLLRVVNELEIREWRPVL